MKQKTKQDYYYDGMDSLAEGKISFAKKLLQEALKLDVEFIDAYNGLVFVYEDEYNKSKARECADLAYKFTQEKFPKWPMEMCWAELDNRQYLRAICNKGIYLHEKIKLEEAEKLYKLLLKLNPNDNQGVRYLLAALFANKPPKIVDGLGENKLENLLNEQNKKHKFWEENIAD